MTATFVQLTCISMLVIGTEAGVQTERVFKTYKTHPCLRQCQVNRPMNCSYDFTVEYYYVLNKACYDCPSNKTDCYRPHCIPADGTGRGILVVNRMLPGPAIQVCEGDRIIVHVHNELAGDDGTSIHWHGVLQRGSQHMDGVALVTQCPISSFEYRFSVISGSTRTMPVLISGTRTLVCSAQAACMALIVRQADEREAHLGLYNEDRPEHTMLVQDWLMELSINRFANHHHAGGDNKPRSILINGRGVLQEFFDNTDGSKIYTPVEVFRVTRGKRYRFRVISNGILTCPIQISIDGHNMTMIASDGNAFEKLEVHSFNIFAGERFDFVLNASKPVGNYWVRARGHMDCGVKKAKQVAILRYDGAPEEDPAGGTTWEDADRQGKRLNPFNKRSSKDLISISDLTMKDPMSPPPPALRHVPDKKFYLYMDFNKIDNFHFHDVAYYPISALERPMHLYMPQMNHISNTLPPSPLLTQLRDLDEDIFCDETNLGGVNCSAEYCQCVHRLQVALGDVVEIVIIDEGVTFDSNHPMHLHGNQFYVVGMDRMGKSTSVEEIKELDAQGALHRNLTHAVLKDSVTVPDGGYAILRFHAINPGFWLFHCHNEWHMAIGMGVIIQVGSKQNMPKVPKNFPKCGHWTYREAADDDEDEPMCVGTAPSLTAAGLTTAMALMMMLLLH